jgi:hypothetical protein
LKFTSSDFPSRVMVALPDFLGLAIASSLDHATRKVAATRAGMMVRVKLMAPC